MGSLSLSLSLFLSLSSHLLFITVTVTINSCLHFQVMANKINFHVLALISFTFFFTLYLKITNIIDISYVLNLLVNNMFAGNNVKERYKNCSLKKNPQFIKIYR